ncbi:MAG TPA: hypothetical protein VFC44_05190 [Candidatus Saccharimonadales bacterium]|nr:hypothetical protein [Candidatus Saccharimonadales bacterium]
MKLKKSAAPAALKPNDKVTSTPPTLPAVTSPAAKTAPPTLTTIDVKLDVGFGNAVFLRGHGGGLTWDHGVPMACVDGKTWRWSGTVKDPLTFKLLLNDKIWSAGHDLTIKPGQKLEVAPSFA